MISKQSKVKQQNTKLRYENKELRKRQSFLSGINIGNIESLEKIPDYLKKIEL